jgi:hypothetical protein
MTSIIEFRRNIIEYLVLAFIFLAAFVALLSFRFDPHLQRRVIYATSAAYFGWSLYHHYRKGDIHASILIEYLLFILLAVVVTGATLF